MLVTSSKGSPRYSGKTAIVLLTLLLLTLGLAACGGENVPQPTATPTVPTTYRVDSDPNLFFTVSVLENWAKTVNSANSVTYAPTGVSNLGLTVSNQKINNLQPNSTTLVDNRLSELKKNFGDVATVNLDTLKLTDREVSLTEVSYTNGVKITELLAQVNISRASTSYLLSGVTPSSDAGLYRDPLKQMMGSMTFNPPTATVNPNLTATPEAPTPDTRGSLTPPPGTNETKGQAMNFVTWTTPSLTTGQNAIVTLSGTFPSRWNWGLKGFPNDQNPGITLNSPKPGPLGMSGSEATIQLGVVSNAFPSEGAPSAQDWAKAYSPVLEMFNRTVLPGFGTNIQLTLPTDVNGLKKASFIVRSDPEGRIRVRGSLYFRAVGRNMLAGVIFLGPDTSLNDKLVGSYEADMVTIMNSLKIGAGQ